MTDRRPDAKEPPTRPEDPTPDSRDAAPRRQDPHAGHEPGASPQRASRCRPRAWRAARRGRSAHRTATSGTGQAAARLVEATAHPRHQRRWSRFARPARPQAGTRSGRRRDGRGPRDEPERGRPPEDAHAPASGPRAESSTMARSPTRSTAPRPTRSASPSWASSIMASISSRPESTTGPTSATTSRIPAP